MAMSFLGRTLITKSNRNLLPSILSRSFAAKSFSSFSSPSPLRSLVALTELRRVPSIPFTAGLRSYSTRRTTSSLNDPSPNWNNRPPQETILLEGCDFEHWLIVTEKPEGEPTRDEIIDGYIKLVASVVGSEDEARKQIYSVSTRHYYAIGVIVTEELSYKFKEIPTVRWVLPDSYLDVRNKDYGGEPFIDGRAVPYDPKYHEEWVRNNARANERSRRNDRPRNFDRSRNFERRRENMQNRDFQAPTGNQGPGPNVGGGPPAPNAQNPVPSMGGMPPNANVQNKFPNHGGMPPNANVQNSGPNHGGMPPNANMQNSGPNYRPNTNMQNPVPNYGPHTNVPNNGPHYGPQGGGPNAGYSNNVNMGNSAPNYGGMPPSGPGPNVPNYGGMPPSGPGPNAPNYGGMPPSGSGPNAGYSNSMPNAGNVPNHQYGALNNGGVPYQNREGPGPVPNYQNSYAPNRNAGDMPSGNAYQVRDVPGRDY